MVTPREIHQTLGRLSQAVAAAVDNQPRCVEAVALLVALAQQFGISLEPRAVSMVGQNKRRPEGIVVTGRMAQEFVASHGGPTVDAEVVAASPDGSEFQRAGHLVAVHNDPGFLLDPSFGQFVRAGLPDTVVVDAFDSAEPDWRVDIGDRATVLYLMDPTNGGWQEAYAAVSAASEGPAAEIARHLRSGGLPHNHGIVLGSR